MRQAEASSLALFLIAQTADTHRPEWELVPRLTEAEWAVIDQEISTWIDRFFAVAGSTGLEAFREATS